MFYFLHFSRTLQVVPIFLFKRRNAEHRRNVRITISANAMHINLFFVVNYEQLASSRHRRPSLKNHDLAESTLSDLET